MEKKPRLHDGYRERMRARFCADPNGFADHEILEMLLYYIQPRRDTNELAHELIENFGSLGAVLEAGRDRLSGMSGVGESTAVYLSLLGETAKRYTIGKLQPEEGKSDVFDTPEKIVSFLWPRFLGLHTEQAYLLLFDNGMHLLDCFLISEGDVGGVSLSVRRIAERAYTKHAAAVVLAHNHPGGLAIPSAEDLRVTRKLSQALSLMEIPLLEHFVLSDTGYTGIMATRGEEEVSAAAASPLYEMMQSRLRKNPGGEFEK